MTFKITKAVSFQTVFKGDTYKEVPPQCWYPYTQLHSETFQKPLWGQIHHPVIKSKCVDNVTLCLIKQNAMQIYGAMDYVTHILNFSSRWCQLHTKAPLSPGDPPQYHSLDRQTWGLVWVWWMEISLPTSVIKTWCPSQLGHNLVNILTQLTQPLFIKNHNMESRTHGHPYFLMVYTDMHAHTLTQINTWL